MAITFGKLEREIKIPTGGWGLRVIETTGPLNVDISFAAGETYYWSSVGDQASDFAATIASKLTTASASTGNTLTYTATVAAGENGTGLLTISADGPFGFDDDTDFTNADLYSLMGFASEPEDNTVQVSSSHVKALWLPNAPFFWHRGPSDFGMYETDMVTTESPAGDLKAFYSQKKQVLSLRWRGLSKAKAFTVSESTTNESFQTFWVNDILGEEAYAASPAGPIRWYPDADTDGTYSTYKIPLTKDVGELMREDWIELVNLTIPRMVVVPS